jgi:hypothetical protein
MINCRNRLARSMLLMTGTGVLAAGLVLTKASAASHSSELNPATVVLRGSIQDPVQPSATTEGTAVVLRGSLPSPGQPPAAANPCRFGYDYDPASGCMFPGYSDGAGDWGYWPYYGFDGLFPSVSVSHRFGRGLARGFGRGSGARFGHPTFSGLGHGLPPVPGFGRR